MATYKVLQDIEAEDKLIGPLTLKQFIFGIITLLLMFLAFVFGRINVLLVIPWILPILFFGFMAAPIGRDQPNDVWLAARIRFLIKPRRRHWDQSGMEELVTITAPKKVEIQRTNGLGQDEVRSRLSALSATMDTRGWALKNMNVNLSAQPDYLAEEQQSDRLVNLGEVAAPEVSDIDVRAEDDTFDPVNNMIAKRFDEAIRQQRQETLTKLKEKVHEKASANPQDYSFITNPPTDPGYTTFGARVVAPKAPKTEQINSFLDDQTENMADDEAAFLDKRHQEEQMNRAVQHSRHEKIVKTPEELAAEQAQAAAEAKAAEMERIAQSKTETKQAPRAKLKELGQQSEGLSVASIASLAKHAEQEANLHDNDVISLH